MINVTKPFLPPLDEVYSYLTRIWQSSTLTNGGPIHQEFERALENSLNIENLSLYANGTLALKGALKILGLAGEVITTPYSFVATSNVLLDSGIKPVFVDIDPETFNIDPTKIQEKINKNTSAIMPVHVYGTPCDVFQISKVAEEYCLPVIYDAAHAFGVKVGDRSVLSFGDASALSFHSTKVFHSIEGGALALRNNDLKRKSEQYKNFGFADEISVELFGINAKLNELQSAVGLINLNYIERIFQSRRSVFDIYNSELGGICGIKITHAALNSQNYSYYPVLVESDFRVSRDELYNALRGLGINARRYFFPLIPDFSIYQANGFSSEEFPVARYVSDRILCLPVFSDMSEAEALTVVSAIKKVSDNV